MLITSSWILDLVILLVAGIYLLHLYISEKHKYWLKRGIYSHKPLPFVGNFLDVMLLRKTIAEWLGDQYAALNKDIDYCGAYIFDEPVLIIRNPKFLKNILIKDFSYFDDRNIAAPAHNAITRNMMFFQKNPNWKTDRNKISVAFTSAKLKKMFHLMVATGKELTEYLAKNPQVLEAKGLAGDYSTTLISRCAFGINSHCFGDEESTFRAHGRRIFEFTFRNVFSQTMYLVKPNLVDLFRLEFIDKDTMTYFYQAFQATLKARKDTERYDDMIDIIKDLKKSEGVKFDESDPKLCGIAMMIFLAGFETTSSTIAFTLYELAKNTSIQDTVREEIRKVVEEHGSITYESLSHLHYLDMCINETLRRYPVVPFLDRKCKRDYKIPGTEVVIEKGTAIMIPSYGLNMDEEYFPEPFKYNPERFQTQSHNSTGLVFSPFGEGPRNCIGERFAKLSTKLALISIIKEFTVLPCDRTPKVVDFEKKSVLLTSTVGLPLVFKKLTT